MMDKNSNKQNINSGKYPILFLEPVLQHKIWGDPADYRFWIPFRGIRHRGMLGDCCPPSW